MLYPNIHSALLPVKKFLLTAYQAGLNRYTTKSKIINFDVKVVDWLDALFKELPDNTLDKEHLQTWAWQMAISMAIDIRSHTNSIYHYLNLLESLDFDQLQQVPSTLAGSNFPHMLFEQAAKKTNNWRSLHSSDNYTTPDGGPIQYVRIISIYSYLRRALKAKIGGRYVDVITMNKLLKTRDRLMPNDPEFEDWGLEIDTYLNLQDEKNPIPIDLAQLPEIAEFAGPPPDKFSWVLPYNEFKDLIADAIPGDCSPADISRFVTGRPLRKNEDACNKFQVYIVLPASHKPPAYQPWAGVASWKDFYPYISYPKEDGYGRTFNLRKGTQKTHAMLVARERIFEPIEMPLGSMAFLLQDIPKEQDCEREPVLWESINRFNKAMLLTGDLYRIDN